MRTIFQLPDDIMLRVKTMSQNPMTYVHWNHRVMSSNSHLNRAFWSGTEDEKLALFCDLLDRITPNEKEGIDFANLGRFQHFIMTVSDLLPIDWNCPEEFSLLVIWVRPVRVSFITPRFFEGEFGCNGLIYVLGHRSLIPKFEAGASKVLILDRLKIKENKPPSAEGSRVGTRLYMAPLE